MALTSSSPTGRPVIPASGITTNLSVLTALPNTFSTLYFTNGVLMKVQ
jgi:hypothetical protein